MKKIIVLISMIALVVVALWVPFMIVDRNVAFIDLQKVSESYIKEGMQKQEWKLLRRVYQVSQENYEEVFSYGPISYMEVTEITIFKQSDQAKQKEMLDKAKAHIEKQIKSFEGYGVEQTKLLKNAYVELRGDYIICIVHSDVEKIKNEINDLF